MPKGSEYGPNYRAAMAGAELQWEALSKSMRERSLMGDSATTRPAVPTPRTLSGASARALTY